MTGMLSLDLSDPMPPPSIDSAAPPDTVDGVAVARLNGEPLFTIPADHYLPT